MADGITARLVGLDKLRKGLERAERASRMSVRKSVDESSRAIQLEVRRDVGRIFRKNRRAQNAVRRQLFDNKEDGTAALIFSKFGRAADGRFADFLGPHITGRDITPRRKRFLTVPLQPGRRNRDPSKFPNLKAIRIAGTLFLVRSTRRATIFMFVLVRRIAITKRIRAERAVRRELRQIGDRTRRAFRF